MSTVAPAGGEKFLGIIGPRNPLNNGEALREFEMVQVADVDEPADDIRKHINEGSELVLALRKVKDGSGDLSAVANVDFDGSEAHVDIEVIDSFVGKREGILAHVVKEVANRATLHAFNSFGAESTDVFIDNPNKAVTAGAHSVGYVAVGAETLHKTVRVNDIDNKQI